jgi:Fe-coproporphyrin III synthase
MNNFINILKKYYYLKTPLYPFYSIILFVTNKCNLNCEGCLYKKKINEKSVKNLNISDFNSISKKLGNIYHLQISGGEPFLRKKLFEICKIFINNNKVKLITIPTNGYFPEIIDNYLKKILNTTKCNIGIGLSIDDLNNSKKKFDPNKIKTFGKQYNTLKKLIFYKNNYSNFDFQVSSRITNKNHKILLKLNRTLKKYNKKIKHGLFPIRGIIKNKKIKPPKTKTYLKIISFTKKKNSITAIIDKILFKKIFKGTKWPTPCIAGNKICVIDSDGDLRLCELHKPIGNLIKNNFSTLWHSKLANQQRKIIYNKQCSYHCTHGCFLIPSIISKPFSWLKFFLKK